MILGQRIHTLLVTVIGRTIDIPVLSLFPGQRLEQFKRPDFYYFGAGLPTGRTGKLDRPRLKELIVSGTLKPVISR